MKMGEGFGLAKRFFTTEQTLKTKRSGRGTSLQTIIQSTFSKWLMVSVAMGAESIYLYTGRLFEHLI